MYNTIGDDQKEYSQLMGGGQSVEREPPMRPIEYCTVSSDGHFKPGNA